MWQKRQLGMPDHGAMMPFSVKHVNRIESTKDNARMLRSRGMCGGGRGNCGCWRQPLCSESGRTVELRQPRNCCRRAVIATLTLGNSPPGGTPVRRSRIRQRLLGPIPGAQSRTPPRPTGNQDVMSYARSPLCAISRPVTSVSSSTRMPTSAFKTMVMMIEMTVA